jgi:Fe-S cluster biogenesis protein NfuA/nitrite reductase/ring-hydroxylating ferredoxin subunit
VAEHEPQELVAAVERRLAAIDGLADAGARQTALDAIQSVVELYGAGLERVVEVIAARDDGTLARELGDDELAAHLLLVHGLHPVALEERVRGALEGVRPYLESHGGDVALLAVQEPVVRLRLEGSCSGCPSSTMTLKLAIEDAIRKAAPEIEEVVADSPAATPAPLLQIEAFPAPVEMAPAWSMVGGLPDLTEGRPLVRQVGDREVLFVRVAGQLYGYGPACPACDAPLHDAAVRIAELTCPGCGERYDVLRAGRGLDAPQRHLEPVPLLVDDAGLVKVAIAVPA